MVLILKIQLLSGNLCTRRKAPCFAFLDVEDEKKIEYLRCKEVLMDKSSSIDYDIGKGRGGIRPMDLGNKAKYAIAKSKNKLSKLILVLTYFIIWAFAIVIFWFFTGPTDALGYGIMYLWVLLPVTTFVISVLIGKKDYWGKYKWCSAILLGAMYMLAEYATFSAANMAAFHTINLPQFGMMIGGTIISCIGLAIGTGINYLISKKHTV